MSKEQRAKSKEQRAKSLIHKSCCVALCFMLLLGNPAMLSSFADSPTSETQAPAELSAETTAAIESVVLQVESATWARHFWNWYETGEITEEAMVWYLVDANGPNVNPIHEALELFDDLTGNTVTDASEIWDLIESDPQSYDAFRHYTFTGDLVTQFDSELAIEHLLVAGDSDMGMTSDVVEDYVVSKVDKEKREANDTEPLPEEDENGDGRPDMWEEFLDDLDAAVEASGLAVLKDEDGNWFYIPDGHWNYDWLWPGVYGPSGYDVETGFDCDDYACAMINYLEHKFRTEYRGANLSYLYIYWDHDDESESHAMVLIEFNGFYFVIDPQTGLQHGPYDSLDEAKEGVEEILASRYKSIYDGDAVRIVDRENQSNGDPDPFYKDKEVLDKFREALKRQDLLDEAPYLP